MCECVKSGAGGNSGESAPHLLKEALVSAGGVCVESFGGALSWSRWRTVECIREGSPHMLSCEIGFSPVKCKHTAATTSNLHGNFPPAHNTSKSHLSPRRWNHAAQISIHILVISTLSPGSRKSNHWTKMCRIIYYSSLGKLCWILE